MRCAEEARYQELVRERDEAEVFYMDLLKSMPPVRDRTPEQQARVDNALGVRQKAAYAVWHYGII